MRLFYLRYEKFQTVSGKLSWSHYSELLGISDDLSRSFYEKQCIIDKWNVRELRRQRQSRKALRAMVSRIISDTISASLIVCYDDSVGTRAKKYQPAWA